MAQFSPSPKNWSSKSQEKYESLRIKSADVQEQKKMDMSDRAERESEFTFPLLFVLVKPSKDWMILTHIGEGHLLCLVH